MKLYTLKRPLFYFTNFTRGVDSELTTRKTHLQYTNKLHIIHTHMHKHIKTLAARTYNYTLITI